MPCRLRKELNSHWKETSHEDECRERHPFVIYQHQKSEQQYSSTKQVTGPALTSFTPKNDTCMHDGLTRLHKKARRSLYAVLSRGLDIRRRRRPLLTPYRSRSASGRASRHCWHRKGSIPIVIPGSRRRLRQWYPRRLRPRRATPRIITAVLLSRDCQRGRMRSSSLRHRFAVFRLCVGTGIGVGAAPGVGVVGAEGRAGA